MRQRAEGILESITKSAPIALLAVLLAGTVACWQGPSPGAISPSASAAAAPGLRSPAATTTVATDLVETTAAEEILPARTGGATEGSALAEVAVTSGLRAVIDPETGRLTSNPSRAQLQHLALQQRSRSLSRSTVGLQPFELSRGGRGVNLQGRFQTAMRVERGTDGSFHLRCGDGEEHDHSRDGIAAAEDRSSSNAAAPER